MFIDFIYSLSSSIDFDEVGKKIHDLLHRTLEKEKVYGERGTRGEAGGAHWNASEILLAVMLLTKNDDHKHGVLGGESSLTMLKKVVVQHQKHDKQAVFYALRALAELPGVHLVRPATKVHSAKVDLSGSRTSVPLHSLA